jgi:nucleotide-binding universal stress UspA family protein
MPIKDILLALAPRDERDAARDYAIEMASLNSAHLTAASYPLVPDVPGSVISGEFVAELVQRTKTDAESVAADARKRFEHAAKSAGVLHSFHGFSASVRAVTTDFAMRLRTADIGVLTQHETNDLGRFGDLFIEGALFRSGRPVIIVPREYTGRFSTQRVLIAWDGSVHAARAVLAAMPLLENAEISVFTVEEISKGQDFRGSALVDHLRRHGLTASIAQRKESDIPSAIVNEAEQGRASLVVMGAYGHSRFREFVFGGATRAMLSKMPTPVLMAH